MSDARIGDVVQLTGNVHKSGGTSHVTCSKKNQRTHVCMHVYTCVHICIYVCMSACTICLYVASVSMYVYMYVCLYVCMYADQIQIHPDSDPDSDVCMYYPHSLTLLHDPPEIPIGFVSFAIRVLCWGNFVCLFVCFNISLIAILSLRVLQVVLLIGHSEVSRGVGASSVPKTGGGSKV